MKGLKALLVITIFSIALLLTVGCSKRYHDLPAFSAIPFGDSENHSVGRFKTSYLADQIHAYFRGQTNGPIAVATFVDIDNLYGSSTFGRFIGEQLISELAMKGYNVVELRQAEAMQVMFGQGEFGLSREIAALRNTQDVSGIVVGTYVVSPVRVYLNARLIDPTNSVIVSAGTVEMGKTDEIARMLRSSTLAPTLERVPVRHLGYSSSPYPHAGQYMPPFNLGPRKWNEESFYPEHLGTGTDVPAPGASAPSPKLEPSA